MSESYTLEAQTRDRAGKGTARALRRDGLIPAVIYGDKKDPTMIALEDRRLRKLLEDPGFFTHIWTIKAGSKTEQAIARDVQTDPITDWPMHVDFLRVGKGTKIQVAVPVEFINQELSPGLKRGALLNVVRHEIDLICPVDSIPDHVTVDMTGFDIGETVHFSNVQVPEGLVPAIDDRDFTVATIATPSALRAKDQAAEVEGEGDEEGDEEDTAEE